MSLTKSCLEIENTNLKENGIFLLFAPLPLYYYEFSGGGGGNFFSPPPPTNQLYIQIEK